MNQVKSAYNFVPAPEEHEVFIPSWAEQVSHDIPFEDGESGEIEVEITAETPIFIRNGYAKGNEENEFSHMKKFDEKNQEILSDRKYLIPATSLKGMIRNNLEIISFSRMSKIDRQRNAIRQIIKNKSDVMDEGYEIQNYKKEICCGYLVFKNGSYRIYEAGKPFKIRYSELDSKIGTKYELQFGKKEESNISKVFDNRTAKYKYEHKDLFLDRDKDYEFELHPLDEDGQKSWVSKFQPLQYVRFVENYNTTKFYGRIVNVGQASNYSISTSRRGEYVFKGRKSEILSNTNFLIVDEKIFEDFLFINRHRKSDELKDWEFWRDKIEEGIPVFYRKKDGNIIDFGLSFTYKQPVKNDTKQMNPNYSVNENKNYEMDLAETLFGFINQKEDSLKGRIFVSNCLGAKINETNVELPFVFGNPKSSFTPFYVQQSGKNGKTNVYNTYNSGGTLKGYKKYPVRSKVMETNVTNDTNDKLISKIKPLGAGSTFKGVIRFHNLKPIEIGAILSAITFHNTENTYHQLGGGKGFGYGRVSIKLTSLKSVNLSQNDYLKLFENVMINHSPKWKCHYEELLTIQSTYLNLNADYLGYEDLKRFQDIKKNGEYLDYYTNILGKKVSLKNINSNEEIESFKKKLAQLKQTILEDVESEIYINSKINEYLSLTNDRELKIRIEKIIKEVSLWKQLLTNFNSDELKFFKSEFPNSNKIDLIEKSCFEKLVSDFNEDKFLEFRLNFPLSKRISEIEKLKSSQKHQSGMSSRLQNMTDSKMFFKECPQWVNKLENKTLIGSGFEDSVTSKIVALNNVDFSANHKNTVNWTNGIYKREVVKMFNGMLTEEIWSKLKL